MTITLSNPDAIIQIKYLGAELCSFKTEKTEFIWNGNPEFWSKHSPVLFPIVGTLKNNSYHVNSHEYSLSRHGFARDMAFELIQKKENSATFLLQSSEATLKLYPFEFELYIIYTLEKKCLTIQYKVVNKSKVPMPFSIGAHPAFSLNENFKNYSLEFEQEESLEYFLLENDLLSKSTQKLPTKNKQIDLNYELFANDALVFKSLKSKSLTVLNDSKPVLKVKFDDFPNLGIWTKRNAPFICFEPWFGYSDTLESSGNLMEKEGIQILNPKEIFNCEFFIEVY